MQSNVKLKSSIQSAEPGPQIDLQKVYRPSDIQYMFFFGTVGALVGLIQVANPVTGGVNDPREIFTFLGVFFLSRFRYAIGLAVLVSLGGPYGTGGGVLLFGVDIGDFLITLAIHLVGISMAWLIYHKGVARIREKIPFSVAWISMVLLIYTVGYKPIFSILKPLLYPMDSTAWELYLMVLPHQVEAVFTSAATLFGVLLFRQTREFNRERDTYVEKLILESDKREEAYSQLKVSEEKMRSVVDTAVDAIITINTEGEIQSFNSAATDIFGYARDEVVGQNVTMLMGRPYSEEHNRYLARYLSSHRRKIICSTRELEAKRKNGEMFPMELSVSELQVGGETVFTGMIRDVTKRKRMEAELDAHRRNLERLVEERTADLEEARYAAVLANEAKSRFLANVSHEIRTPLNAIVGFSEIIASSATIDECRTDANRILEQSETLLALISDLLDYSKVEAGRLELECGPFDLSALIKEIAGVAELMARNTELEVDISISGDLPQYVLGDRLRIQQILLNLVTNAIKFTEKGSVSIGAKCLFRADENATLLFSVRDTGIGIEERNQEMIFQSFTQADSSTTRKYGGTGLGVTISRQLAELMGGKIGLESKLGEGSTFWFEVTLETCSPSIEERISESGAQAENDVSRVRKGRILVAEDYPANREVVTHHLESGGYQVVTVDSGVSAITSCQDGPFDLILMDIQMPEMDGYQTARLIRSLETELANVPIVALTAYADKGTRLKCKEARIDDLIIKPVRRDSLLRKVGEWIDQNDGTRYVVAFSESEPNPISVEATNLPIDYSLALEGFFGDKQLTDDVIIRFLGEVEKQLNLFKRALDCGDSTTMSFEAHKIAGGAVTLSAIPLSEAARRLEQDAKQGDTDRKRTALLSLEQEFSRLKDYIHGQVLDSEYSTSDDMDLREEDGVVVLATQRGRQTQ